VHLSRKSHLPCRLERRSCCYATSMQEGVDFFVVEALVSVSFAALDGRILSGEDGVFE
jgi:hypothetical protein